MYKAFYGEAPYGEAPHGEAPYTEVLFSNDNLRLVIFEDHKFIQGRQNRKLWKKILGRFLKA